MKNVPFVVGVVLGSFLSLGGLRAQTCEQMPRGAVGWWPGDGNAHDLSVPANNGTIVGATSFATGIDGQAFAFDGLTGRVDVLDTPALRPVKFSLVAWVQYNVANPNSCIICKQFGTSDANSYSLWTLGGVLHGGMYRFTEAIGPVLVANHWYHLATTYDGIIIRLYVDGELVATAQGPATPVPYDTNPVILGADDNGVNNYAGFLNGMLDEPMIFNRALSQCEIHALYRARGRGECKGDGDLDGILDFQDNCLAVANAAQVDGDLDGTGDACDCAPADPTVFAKPGDYKGMKAEASDWLDWCLEPSGTGPSTVYDVVRGDLDELPVGGPSSECKSGCVAPLSGLVSWWPGDGSGSALVGINGTLENGATTDTGFVRQAFRFDGVDDRVRTAAMSVPNTFSVAAWVNSDAVNQGGYHRIVENSFSSGFYLGVDATGTVYKFIVKSAVAPYGAAQGGTFRPGVWQLVVGTYNGTTGTLYVNGVAVGSDAFAAPGTVNLPVYIGVAAAGGVGWKGRIDEVRIWNRALTAAEVRAMYDAGSAGECKAALGGVDAPWTTPFVTDGTLPAPGHGWWYVFHGDNACGSGTYGYQTNGTERISAACD